MQDIVLLTVLFIIMLTGPIFFSAIYFKKHKGSILHINQDRVRDERYFGKSFAAMIRNRIGSAENGEIQLSKNEPYIDADRHPEYPETVGELVIARKSGFSVPHVVYKFEKEIYSGQNAILTQEHLRIRAIYSADKMILGRGISVMRWVDAESTLAVYDDCDLGISASAGKGMSIGTNCRFRRIYAPEVRIGQYPDKQIDPMKDRDPRILRLPIKTESVNRRYISKDLINEEGIVENTIISWSSVEVIEGVIIQGDVRSHHGVRLCQKAVVCGNIFAENDILLEKNSVVLGNVFSQGKIIVEDGVMIGQKGRICSVIARRSITFGCDVFLYGYASCEEGGVIVQNSESKDNISEKQYGFLDEPELLTVLSFKDVYDYEHVDQQGFRKRKRLAKVTIPEGALQIPESMFFDCEKLEKVILPTSIQQINDYAFADCFLLNDLENFCRMQITEIGVSAFENCRMIKKLKIPDTVVTIHGAAFADCDNLADIRFSDKSALERIEDHCFRNCSSLRELWIPDQVKKIGISAFRGCSGLKKLSLPQCCMNEPGVIQLQKDGFTGEIEIREFS